MRVIAQSTLRVLWEKHPNAEDALRAWYEDVERVTWKTPAVIRAAYPTASFLANNRVVFNIRGNHYRIIVHIHYNTQIVYIRFVGTHAEYDQIDAETIVPRKVLYHIFQCKDGTKLFWIAISEENHGYQTNSH